MTKPISKTKTIFIFVTTILLGFILFAVPNVFFGVTKINGGLIGINLLLIALFQFVSVLTLLHFSLKLLKKDFKYIGYTGKKWKKDLLIGAVIGGLWVALQFIWIIPNTGGKERDDIRQMISMMDGTIIGLFSYIVLGVVGGGITEEIYNRGYFINVLKATFKNPTFGLWVSTTLSLLFFAAGHLPTDLLGWFDILIPSIAYTLLFIYTGRLTASIVAHGIYNMAAILLTYTIYYP